MIRQLLYRLDAYGREHPLQMTLATVLMTVVATLLLLSQSNSAKVLYEAF